MCDKAIMNGGPKSLLLAVSTAFVAYYFLKWRPHLTQHADLDSIESKLIEVWSKSISWPSKKFSKVAVGTNANVDLIVSGVELLNKLGLKPGTEYNHDSLHSLSDLQESFAYYFSRGKAAERLFSHSSVYKEVVSAAASLQGIERYIGGNAALMAKKASSLFPDVEIQFVGPIGPLLRSLMPKNISIPDTSYISEDEVHLIMEYKVGQQWGLTQAPVANRFICSYDASNSEMTMIETFFGNLGHFQPELVLISGLHMLDGQETDLFSSRVDALVRGVQQVARKIPIHLELASMANRAFMKDILEKVLPEVTSLGLNEQELTFASQAAGGPYSYDLQDWKGQPLVHQMSDIILWLLRTYGRSSRNQNSRLTRIHFHTLTYHITGTHRSEWSNVNSAAMAGSRIAGMQACDVKTLDAEIVDLKIPLEFKLFSGDSVQRFDANKPVHVWNIDDYNFVFSPVLVCKEPVKTVGLGDAISATGLMFSQFTH